MSVSTLPTPDDRDLLRTVAAIRQLAQGRTNAVGTFSLTAGATSTVVANEYCAAGSYVFLTPLTANAAGALATTYVTAANVGNKTFTVTHANAATTDRTFAYIAMG